MFDYGVNCLAPVHLWKLAHPRKVGSCRDWAREDIVGYFESVREWENPPASAILTR